ncbi:MAG: DNA mismatch endonuclease Vsr [Candidatus Competibacteraceae bacterium]|nr:DNA mismatch endonuclease Vsr [Candidatus Competibacteraceae bacterium]
MARVGPIDTRPEMVVRRTLHAAGLRFRLHRRDLPGTPDIVLPSRRIVIFVHGCFWHQHEGCRKATIPKTRTEFWSRKFSENVRRDARNREALISAGWSVYVLWECELAKPRYIDGFVAGIAALSPNGVRR